MIVAVPLQAGPNLIPPSVVLLAAVFATLLLWRMGTEGEGEPGARELPDGTRLGRGERAAAVAAREYVVDAEGAITVREVREEVFPDHSAGYPSAGRWWAEAVGPALDHDDAIEVPRRGDRVALSGFLDAVDDPPEDPTWFPDPTPPPGERFGHALVRRRDRHAQVRVSDGRNEATLRVHAADDVRVVSWEGEGVSVDWLADARDHVREAVRAGSLPDGDEGGPPDGSTHEGARIDGHDSPADGDRAPGDVDRPRERESGREP